MNKQEFFNKLADTIDQHGWFRGSFGNEDWGFCVYGAAIHACGKINPILLPTEMRQWIIEFGTWLEPETPLFVDFGMDARVLLWNDAEGRTKEEVVLNLRKFADEQV